MTSITAGGRLRWIWLSPDSSMLHFQIATEYIFVEIDKR